MLLNRLVDDLQELAMADAGQLKLVFQPVDIKEVIEKAIQSLKSQVKDKEINLVADLLILGLRFK